MDYSFFPRTTQNKKFPYYSVRKYIAKKEGIDITYSGFLFIGKNGSSFEKLLRVFKRGHAVSGIEQAKAELTSSLSKEKNIVPEMILCDSHFSSKEIQCLYQFLNSHPLLNSTPLILDGTGLSEKEWLPHKKTRWVDEILFLHETEDQHLQSKCRFLRRMKAGRVNMNREVYTNTLTLEKLQFSYFTKRAFEITFSFLLLALLAPVLLLIALAIKAESKGPVFYISKRAGKGYRIFNFIKFRTMKLGADTKIEEYAHLNQYGSDTISGPKFVKINNDPRVTRVGEFLRNTSLDELPQLLNVLFGDMSLVGNRPLPLYEAATLTTDDFAQRFLAPAGITGLWQIKKRGQAFMSVEDRINLDIDYAKNYNFMYDLWIMANTPSALIQKSSV